MKTIIGIDVGKTELFIYWNDKIISIANDYKAIVVWLKKNVKQLKVVSLIAFEPTGGYELSLIKALSKVDLPYCMVHANHVRNFAKANGILAKTDRIDAKVIAEFATAMNIQPKKLIHDNKLKDLLNRRDQLVNIRTQEKNRLEKQQSLEMGKDIKKHIRWLTKQITALELKMKKYLDENQEINQAAKLYQSTPGIGVLTSLRIITDLPELLTYPINKLSALVGVAPINCDSGKLRGRRYIRGGRSKIRSYLYLAALSAIRYNPLIKRFYQKLRQKGKAAKVALVAAMHKLLFIIKSVADRQTPWKEDLNVPAA
jgi:transposase